MTSEPLLNRLRDASTPTEEQKARIRQVMQRTISGNPLFDRAIQDVTPDAAQQSLLWGRILRKIDSPAVSGIFDQIRTMLTPAAGGKIDIRQRLVPARVSSSYRISKWVAAFVLVLVALRASPALFLPRTEAESFVVVIPTQGTVMLSSHGLWQPLTGEVRVYEGMQLRTAQGEATLIFHDDGTVRLGPDTIVTVHDVSNRPEPALAGPTLSLSEGRIWVQGLLPHHLRGITVATTGGNVVVHGGSVSVSHGESTQVRIWDRLAMVDSNGTGTTLVAGEQVQLGKDDELRVRAIEDAEFTDTWVTQNLKRDAVHQREVSQLQQERRAAEAGILPGNPLYTMKRVAERVDVLFTLDHESRVQKKLDQASARLNEAAAVVAGGHSGTTLLAEYTQALLEVSGTGSDSVTQFLVRQEVAENTAEFAAALPDDEHYVLKRAVLEASALLPGEMVDQADVQGVILVDALDVLQTAIESGDTKQAEESYAVIEPYLLTMEDAGDLKPDIRKEVLSLLSSAAEKIQESGTGAETELAVELSPFLPVPQKPAHVPMTESQIMTLIEQIVERIFLYDQPRSRWNQLQHELAQLEGHPDEGTILRHLYHALPENGLAKYVRTAIQELREERSGI